MSRYTVCLVTIDDMDKAARIARNLVERKLVACVNIVPELRSIYAWQDRICDERECLMIMKTRQELFDQLRDAVKEIHPYDVPEIISLGIAQGLADYLKWIDDSTAS